MGLFSRRRDNVATTAPTGINNGYGPNDGVNTNSGHGINSGVHNNNGYGAHDGMNTNTHNRLGHNDSVNTDTRRGRKRLRRNTGEKRALFDMNSSHLNRRPSFGQWLKMTWLDLLTMAIMGAIGLGVYEAHPAPSRSFPVTFTSGDIVYPEFAYPLRKEIIPIWLAALLGSLIPIFVILCMQIRIRSFWDVNNAVIGLLYSLISAAVFQVFLKWLIGGLRPHFLSVCDPDPALLTGGNGFQNIMYQRNICRGDVDQIDDSLESFPSGHSTAAWAGFLYLYYYLNAKLKVFSNYHPAMWKIIVLYAPLLGATLITGALTIDEFHNWYDCLAGAIIGSVMATSAYRMVYASVWDFRFNHIPLMRDLPFSYGAGEAGAGGFESTVLTRQAGWGYEEAWGGAPFDAAHNLRGQQAGFNNSVTRHQHGHSSGGGGMLGMGGGHHNHNRRDGDIEHNAVNTGQPGYDGEAGAMAGNTTRSNRVSKNYDGPLPDVPADGSGSGRYHHSSRSLERKAVAGRMSGDY